MGVIRETSPIIRLRIGNPHGRLTGGGLSSYLIERWDGNPEIYVMDADGGNPRNLTNHPEDDLAPAWFGPAFSVSPAGKILTLWGRVKQADR